MKEYLAIEISNPEMFQLLCKINPKFKEFEEHPELYEYHFILFDFPEEGDIILYDIEAFNGDFDHIENDKTIRIRKLRFIG